MPIRCTAAIVSLVGGAPPTAARTGRLATKPCCAPALISVGLDVGLLPASARHATPHPPVAWLHIDAPDCHRTLRFVWHQSTYLPTAARLFRDYSAQRLRVDTAGT